MCFVRQLGRRLNLRPSQMKIDTNESANKSQRSGKKIHFNSHNILLWVLFWFFFFHPTDRNCTAAALALGHLACCGGKYDNPALALQASFMVLKHKAKHNYTTWHDIMVRGRGTCSFLAHSRGGKSHDAAEPLRWVNLRGGCLTAAPTAAGKTQWVTVKSFKKAQHVKAATHTWG